MIDNTVSLFRYFSELPHPPGSARNKKLADDIAKEWEKSGFDKTEIFKYNILLSFPNSPGQISLLDGDSLMKKLIIENEPAMDETEKNGDVLWPFNAFSAKRIVTVSIPIYRVVQKTIEI